MYKEEMILYTLTSLLVVLFGSAIYHGIANHEPLISILGAACLVRLYFNVR